MKFNLKDFLELDTKSLLAVNGGTDCSGSSSPSSSSNSDGLLSSTEIKDGMNDYLDAVFGDIYDVKTEVIDGKNLTTTKLNEISSKSDGTTYVLGYAPDCYGGHWVVLEGYSQDNFGNVTFSYDGSSNNDMGRTYILGVESQNLNSNKYAITKIQSFTVYKK